MTTREDILSRFHRHSPDDSMESQRDTLANMVSDMADHIADLEKSLDCERNAESVRRFAQLATMDDLQKVAADLHVARMANLQLQSRILDIAQSLVDATK
jgi:uncharacterized protein YerC